MSTAFLPGLVSRLLNARDNVPDAAMKSGVALRPIADLDAYKTRLEAFGNSAQLFMQPVINLARRDRDQLYRIGG